MDGETDMFDKRGNAPLHVAVEMQCRRKVEVLCKVGANLNEKNKWGDVPLALATKSGYLEIAQVLID